MHNLSKSDWILLALREHPLDRIRLMKTLFLTWHRMGRNIPGFFRFVPYMYGPCSFEVYSTLEELLQAGFIVQPPHPIQQWGRYYLTEKGRARCEAIKQNLDQKYLMAISESAQFAAQASFRELLKKVYEEAPDFAVNSVLRMDNREDER